MKILQICIFVACCVLLTGTAAGYTIAFTISPEEAMAGESVTVTGTSNIPAGYTDEAVLYRQVQNFLPKEVDHYPFTVTEGGNWGIVIDTTGFSPATYNIQLPKSGEYPYGSSVVLMRTFIIAAPPGETPVSATTTTTPYLTPMTTTSPEEVATPTIPPEPTTSPAGMATALAATGISALAFASGLRRRNE